MKTFSEAHTTILDGKIIVEGEPLVDGAKVTVIAQEDERTFELSLKQEAELLKAIGEIERGEGIDGSAFLEELEDRD